MLRLEFSKGESLPIDETNQLYMSPFVQSFIDEEDEDTTIGKDVLLLPEFIDRDTILCLSSYLDMATGSRKMGFGRYASCTYLEAYTKHNHYYNWARQQP